jgi:hypothetical protein
MGLISNGTTIFDNGAMASGIGGSMTFISSATASASASIEFTLGNYKEYQFYFVNIHPSVDFSKLNFNFSTDSGSNYNVVKTNTNFKAQHRESGATELEYLTGGDLAQSTADAQLIDELSNDNDGSGSGILQLFNPSSTTYVKHFLSMSNGMGASGGVQYQRANYTGGYANTTSALTNIIFRFSSGNIDAGTILMFGIV